MGNTLVGSTLGRFRVDRLLGRGGMGAVYAAFDEKLERDVALKVLNEEGDVALQKKRLLREARFAAKLTHPNIATVYEVDELDRHLYIVMELLEGSSLRKILSARKMDVEEAISVGRDIARALARAHSAGVIHRDIKPENVFVTTPSPDAMLTKVLDFGLARQRAESVPVAVNEDHTSTSRGEMWGTPGYVSPEQAFSQPVDVRTDIFSFGVVLYEMLAGIKPFRGDTAIAMILATTKQEPRALREINPDIPIAVEEIVRRCLQKDRQARFDDGAALSAALEGYFRGTLGDRTSRVGNVVGSNPHLPMLSLEELGGSLSEDDPGDTRTTGGSSAIALTTAEPEAVPSLQQQRHEHMKLVAAVGAGVGFAFILVIAALAWFADKRADPSSPGSAPPPPSSALVVEPPVIPPTEAAPGPVVAVDDPVAAPPASASAVVNATAGRDAPSAAPPAPSSRPRKKVADDCKEKFYIDRSGVKIPKRHCL